VVEVLVQPPVGRLELTDKAPEALRVIHVTRMAKLVNHHVTQVSRLQEHQAVVQADRPGTGMTSPAGLLPTDMHFLEGVIRLR